MFLNSVCSQCCEEAYALPGQIPKAKASSGGSVGVGGDDDPRGLLRIADAKAPPAKRASGKGKAKAPSSSTGSKAKSSSRAPSPSALPPPPPKSAPPPVHDSDDDMVLPASSSSAAKATPMAAGPSSRMREGREFKAAIGGGQVVYKEYNNFAIGTSYRNWIFKCNKCPVAESCQRTMGLGPRNTSRHGSLEPLAYLHAWRDTPPGPQGHRKTNPKAPAVTQFFNDNRAELQALEDIFLTP